MKSKCTQCDVKGKIATLDDDRKRTDLLWEVDDDVYLCDDCYCDWIELQDNDALFGHDGLTPIQYA